MEFGHGFIDEGFVDDLVILGSRLNEAGGGDIVDLARYAASVIMDENFGLQIEDFF